MRRALRRLAWLAGALLATAGTALAEPACDIGAAPGDRWSLARDGGAEWLVTPCGQRFLSLGVNVLDGGAPERESADRVW